MSPVVRKPQLCTELVSTLCCVHRSLPAPVLAKCFGTRNAPLCGQLRPSKPTNCTSGLDVNLIMRRKSCLLERGKTCHDGEGNCIELVEMGKGLIGFAGG